MAEEFKKIVDSSFDKGFTPLWLYTNDYIYGLVPADDKGARWIQVAYTFEDPEEPLDKSEKGADLAFQYMLEELEKGISFYIEDFKVPELKKFAKSVETKPGAEKIKAVIDELMNNSQKYANNIPIVRSKADLAKVKEKVK